MAEVPVTAEEAPPPAPPGAGQNNGAIDLAGPTVKRGFSPEELLIGAGWLGTGLALSVTELPFQFLLMDKLKLRPDQMAAFLAVASIPIYIKPFAGILSDAVPLFGTRRRHYLLFGLALATLFYLLLGAAPRTFAVLLCAYFGLSVFLTVNSTVLGGLMVEVGKRNNNTGRLSAQRVGITKFVEMVGGYLGGVLAKQAFFLTAGICAALNALLIPLIFLLLKEPPTAKRDTQALKEIGRQLRIIVKSKTLWSAAGLVTLVIVAPGFETPLLYFQRNTLKFDAEFIGILKVVKALGGFAGAFIYGRMCRGMNLRALLGWSIVIHTLAVPFYLFYNSAPTALVITAFEGMTMVLAILPLYDLAARATPRGSEALGYCVMMSVWNFTHKLSDVFGSVLYTQFQLTFSHLIWVNTATTGLVLVAVPFLPAVLMNRKDGEPEAVEGAH